MINTDINEVCALCATKGVPLYCGKADQLFDAPGSWNLEQCPMCKLIWLNPFPTNESLSEIYAGYYTHGSTNYFFSDLKDRRIVDRINDYFKIQAYLDLGYCEVLKKNNRSFSLNVGPLPFLGRYEQTSMMGVKPSWGQRLLDIGAGNGEYLKLMKTLGWEVEGTETDLGAIEYASSTFGIKMHFGFVTNLKLPTDSFDVITMNHVIEHVYDPLAVMQECRRLLRPGGRLVILTPNSSSLGHRWFKSNWRGLEVPRHMHVFSIENFQQLAKKANFEVESLHSSARIARYLYSTSRHIEEGRKKIGQGGNRGYSLVAKSILFQIYEEIALLVNPRLGEEIVFIGVKA